MLPKIKQVNPKMIQSPKALKKKTNIQSSSSTTSELPNPLFDAQQFLNIKA